MIIQKPRIVKHRGTGRWLLRHEHFVGFTTRGHELIVFESAREAWAYAFDGITPEGWKR